MPLAPVLRGQLIRANKDAILMGDDGCQEPIHSLLLMTLSPYFDTVLERCKSKEIRIDGADRQVLSIIKEYAYEGNISGLSETNVQKVFRVADMYNIISIINECQLFIRNNNLAESEPETIDVERELESTVKEPLNRESAI